MRIVTPRPPGRTYGRRMPKLSRKLTYANVMATIAVFIALGGTSYAALRITGKNVKDGSLSGRDIKNKSLTGGDVADGTLKPADFKPGELPAGPRGAKGPAGPQGAPGDPAAVQGFGARATSNFSLDYYDVPVVSKNLPAGKYVLSATAEVQSAGNPTTGYMGGIAVVDCYIPGYHTDSYYLSPNGTYVAESESLSLNSVVDHPGGAVALKCSRTWNNARVTEAALTAVKVGSLG